MFRHFLSQFQHPNRFGLSENEYKESDFIDFFTTGFLYSQDKLQKIFAEELQPGQINDAYPFPILRGEDGIYACVNLLADASPENLTGSFGRVIFVQNLKTGEWFAGKIQKNPQQSLNKVLSESKGEALESVEHSQSEELLTPQPSSENKESKTPPITKETLDIIHREHSNLKFLKKCDPQLFNFYKGKTEYSMTVMKLEKGIDLFNLINEYHDALSPVYQWPPLLWLKIILGTLKAMSKIHSDKLIHLDIKLENILFDIITGSVSIIDFGLSCKTDDSISKYTRGTDNYFDPFMMKTGDHYHFQHENDIYSLGTVILEILHKRRLQNQKFKGPIDHCQNLLIKDVQLMNFVRSFQKKTERPSLPSAISFFENYINNYEEQHPEEVAIINRLTQKAIEAQNNQLADSYVQSNLNLIKKKKTELKSESHCDRVTNIQLMRAEKIKAPERNKKALERKELSHFTDLFNEACQNYYQHKVKYGAGLGFIRRYFFTSTETLQVIKHIRQALANQNVALAQQHSRNYMHDHKSNAFAKMLFSVGSVNKPKTQGIKKTQEEKHYLPRKHSFN